MLHFFSFCFITFTLFIFHPSFSQHTFSICAVDSATGEVGSAGASCINNSNIISDMHPGFGVMHTQAAYITFNQVYARTLMEAELPPAQIIDSMLANDFFGDPSVRQYGIAVIINGQTETKAFTGANCMDYKNHIEGAYYTIHGNILSGQGILDSMEARFLRATGSLACRLMEAMQGANVVGADTRCFASGNSSLSAFLRVAKPGDAPNNPFINLIIPSGPVGFEPIDSLQQLFDVIEYCGEDTTGTGLNSINKNDVSVFYNGQMLILNGAFSNIFSFEVYDSGAKRILVENISGGAQQYMIPLNQLPAGMYFWKALEKEKSLKSGKFLVPKN